MSREKQRIEGNYMKYRMKHGVEKIGEIKAAITERRTIGN
jgi:hypothetical protein